MELTAQAWQCEYPECRHIWLRLTDAAPARCARCKRAGWNGRQTTKQPRTARVVASADLPSIALTVASALPQPAPRHVQPTPQPQADHQTHQQPGKLAQLGRPRPAPGEKCPHGFANWLTCPDCRNS